MNSYDYKIDMINIDRQLIQSFWSQKNASQNDLEIYIFFYLRKLSRFLNQSSSTALDKIKIKYCSVLTQY